MFKIIISVDITIFKIIIIEDMHIFKIIIIVDFIFLVSGQRQSVGRAAPTRYHHIILAVFLVFFLVVILVFI